jgi:hypothetical protein
VKQIIPFLLSIFLATPLWADYTLSITATNGTVILDPAGGTYADGTVVWLTPIPSAGYYFSGWSGDARGKAVAARLVVNSNKSVTANFAAWTPPVGIPTPTFGITQTYRMYDDPANRNVALTYHESASGGFYTHYVDNTDEDATDTLPGGGTNPGTVDLPRLTLPLRLSAYIPNAGAGWLPAGSVIEVHGGPYEMSGFTSSTKGPACYADASVDQPIFIRGVGNPHLKATTTTNIGAQWWIYGRGLVIEGFYFDQTCLWLSGYNSFPVQNPEYIAIRNNQMVGTPLDATYSAIKVSPLASAAIYANHITVYGNDIGYYGDAEYDLDSDGDNSDDVMGFVASPHTEYVWITDNYIHHNGGDSIHLGISAARTVRNIYIGRNHMRSDRENAVDIKQCQDIIVSQNVMHDYLQKGRPDDGLGVSIHEGTLAANTCPYQIWILYNDIYDCGYAGIATMSSDEVYIIGNIVHDVKGPTTNPSLHCKAFSAFGFTGTEHHYYIENTVYNCQAGYMLLMNSANSVYLANNIVDTLTDGTESSWENHIGITNYTSNATIENCLLYEAGGQAKFWWGSVAKTLAEMQALGQCNGCLEADPQFADADNDDFHLQPTSPAIDAGTSAGVVQEVSNRFEQLYGLDIRKDTEGKARTDAWEIGAYEYVLTPISDLAVSRTSQNSITLTWTVPGELGVTGQPATYDLRYAIGPITAANWEATIQVLGEPAAGAIGQPWSFTVSGLNAGTTYYLALKVLDEGGHASAMSNVVSGTTPTTGNHAPVLQSIGDQSVVETETLTFSISATDADGDLLTYSTGTLPVGAAFDAGTRAFTWMPTNLQGGRYHVMFQVGDSQVNVSETITITVREGANQAPVLASIGDKGVSENASLSFSLSATDPDGDLLIYSAAGLPSGASLADRIFTWTPTYDQAGSYPVTFTVSDGELTDSQQITITVASVSDRTPPSAQAVYPAVDAIQVPRNALIALTISDGGLGIDAGTVTIQVNNQLVYAGDSSLYQSAYGNCWRVGTAASYRYYYQPARPFDFDQHVLVNVAASDVAHNVMTPLSCHFMTEMRSFGQNQAVSSSGDASGHPALATDSQGNLWATWHAGQVGVRDIYVAKRSSQLQQWNTPLRLTSVASDRCNPALAVGPDDALYLAWQDNRRGHWDVYVSASADGSTWGNPVAVTDSDENQNPVIIVDQASPYRVYIAWERGASGGRDIYLASCSSYFAGKTITQVTSDPADQSEPSLAVGSDNTVYLFWTDWRNALTNSDIYGSSSAAAWSNVAVVTGSGNQSHPAVTVAPGTSTLHLVWQSSATGNLDVLCGTSDGLPGSALAGSSLIDDTTGADQFAPSIVATRDHANNVHVYACWQDNRAVGGTQDSDLYMAEIRSGTGGTNILVRDDGTNSNQSEPALGCDEYGQPVAVWTDGRSGTPRIYGACSVYAKPVALASALITRTAGGRVGVDPVAISSVRDVSIQIPASACDGDVTISISEIQNLPKFTALGIAGYEISPSGVQFAFPATVTIPYTKSGTGQTTPYWYDALTATLSQQGLTDVTYRTLANGIPVVSFKTSHLTTFYLLENPVAAGGSGGGGCAISSPQGGSVVEFFLPFGVLGLFMLILARRDRRSTGT